MFPFTLQPATSSALPAAAPSKKARPRLPPDMAGMAAVTEQRERLQRMTRTFTQRVSAFLAAEFGAIADSTLDRVEPTGGVLSKGRFI